jgi:hypothetical protein
MNTKSIVGDEVTSLTYVAQTSQSAVPPNALLSGPRSTPALPMIRIKNGSQVGSGWPTLILCLRQ